MSCINITQLVLSDTFNTWFERSNQCIEALNSFSFRGLSAHYSDGFRGFKFQDSGNCYYTVDLKTGPFIGFITSGEGGYSADIHGTGDYVNPYNLTLKFNGTEQELDKSEVVTGDYLMVSDSSDSGLLKKTTADAFLTRLRAGSKIVVSQDSDGVWTITYVPLFFEATFKDIVYNSNVITREIGFTHNSSSGWTGAYSYGPTATTNPEQVLPYSITIYPRNIDAEKMDFTAFGGTGGGNIYYADTPTPQIPNTTDWFSKTRTELQVIASITSDTQSGASPFYPFTPENITAPAATIRYRFAWRYAGFSTTSVLNLSGVQSYAGSYNMSGGGLVSNPLTDRTVTFSNEGRLYFLITADGNYSGPPSPATSNYSSTYSLTPIFKDPLGGAVMEEGWEELGLITKNFGDGVTKSYIVFRSVNSYDANRQIIIGGE